MPDHEKTSVAVAIDDVRGKPSSGGPRPVQACGDIGLKIGRDGTWYYQGSAFRRKPLVKLFASVLRQADDGKYYLVTPAETVPIEVEDAPFIAVEMTVTGRAKEQRLSFRTNVDDLVTADRAHPLSFQVETDGSFTPFVLVRDRLKARLARAVYYELVAAAVSEAKTGREELGVWSSGAFFLFPAAEPRLKA